MKNYYLIFPFLILFELQAGAGFKPTVIADIDQSAIEKASSPEGGAPIFGLVFNSTKYDCTIRNANEKTAHKLKSFGIITGMGYTKSFKNNFLVGAEIMVSAEKKKKIEGSWSHLDAAFAAEAGDHEKAVFETDPIGLDINLLAGYNIAKYKTSVFLKVGATKIGAKFIYYAYDREAHKVKFTKIIPTAGFGAEKKINSKWTAAFEVKMLIPSKIKEEVDGIFHEIKTPRTSIKIYAKYKM